MAAFALFSDLLTDTLFLATGGHLFRESAPTDPDIHPTYYIWRSKVISFPYRAAFSCMQVEWDGGGYVGPAVPGENPGEDPGGPGENLRKICVKVYLDGELAHAQEVKSAKPFRLPAIPCRTMEIEVNANVEIFNIAFAQSMQELASV